MPPARGVLRDRPTAVKVVGLLSSASGLGKSARLCIRQLQKYGWEVSASDVAGLFSSDDGVSYAAGQTGLRTNISIYHLNAPMLLPGIIKAGLGSYYRSYNVAYWAWELECLPNDWVDALRFVDAVMVPSTFCKRTIERYTAKPVLVVPHPIQTEMPEVSLAKRNDRTFRVLSVFNLGSSFERKNPLAVVRAFRAAFGSDVGAELLLKTSQGHRYPQDLAILKNEIANYQNVKLVDEVWSDLQVAQLYCSSDAYISLHRSEGFGLTLAEAILRELPVIATGWSGNVDFCAQDKVSAVEYILVLFADSDPAYRGVPEALWAEPSIDGAARELKKIRNNPDGAITRARSAKAELLSYLVSHSYASALDDLVGLQGAQD
jgi:hypothetical protein